MVWFEIWEIVFYDQGKVYIRIVGNKVKSAVNTIGWLYRQGWQIEIYF